MSHVHANSSVSSSKPAPCNYPFPSTSGRHTHTGTISSNPARTIGIVHIINTLLPLVTLQARQRRTKLLGRAHPRTVLCSATPSFGIMHARLVRVTWRNAPGITDALLWHWRLCIDDTDFAAVSPRRLRIAAIARVVDADLSRIRALDVAETAAEDGLWAVTGLLDRESG